MYETTTITLTAAETELVWIAIEDLQRACEIASEEDCVEILENGCKKLREAQ